METLADIILGATGGWKKRPDGTEKGMGWYGPLVDSKGHVVTELTGEVTHPTYGRLQFPLINPNQSFLNMSQILQGQAPSEDAWDRAIAWAISQGLSGKSPYK